MKERTMARRLLMWLIPLAVLAALIVFVFIPIYSERDTFPGREQRIIMAEGKGEPVVLENERLKMEMDGETTQFTLLDKQSGKVWYSNPKDWGEDPIARGVNSDFLGSTLTLTYMSAGGEVELNNYRDSMINRNFEIIRENESTIRVNYAIGKIERIYLIPDAITEEDMDALLEKVGKLDKKKIQGFYTLMDRDKLDKAENRQQLVESYAGIEERPLYLLKEGTKPKDKEKVEGYFAKAGYTQEQFDRDQELILAKQDKASYFFNASMIYRLEGNDLVVEVPYSDITYDAEHPLVYVSVLPMFGAAGTSEKGFILVPEGSGGLMEYNNGKLSQTNYYANFYGWDYGMERTEAVNETENAFGVFGMSQEDGAFLCMLEGATSYGGIFADIAQRANSYNYVYSKYNLIHYGRFKLSGRTNELIPMYERDIPEDTVIQRYRFLPDSGYVEMAKAYGDYLRARPEFRQEQADDDFPVHVELVGAINKVMPRMGFPVDSVVPVTTFAQAEGILRELKDAGVRHLNLRMTGWSNGGVRQRVLSGVHVPGALGGEKGLMQLIAAAKAEQVPLYLDGISCFAYHSGLMNGFVPFLHAARFTTREMIKLYPYDIVTYQQATWSEPFYLVRPRTAAEYTRNLMNALEKWGAAGIAFRDIGNLLSADYNQRDTVTREMVRKMHVEALQEAESKGLRISIKEGNDYALPYADLVTDINLSGGGYAILDRSVPFLEIAIHGIRNYTGEAINLAGDYQSSLLECAEYGAGLNFTFMKEDTAILQDSAYSCYTGAGYDRWREELIPMILRYQREFSGLNSQRIAGHEFITDDVHMTVYEDGTRVYVNYGRTDYATEEQVVPARDYLVERGDGQ